MVPEMKISTATINAELYEHQIGEHEAFYIPGFVTVRTVTSVGVLTIPSRFTGRRRGISYSQGW